MASRFEDIQKNNEIGPGHYEIVHIDKVNAAKFGKELRILNKSIDQYNIDPG